MKYRLDSKKFKRRLVEEGYQSVFEFAQKTRLHRNTIQNLLKGQTVFLASLEKIAEKLRIDPLELVMPDLPLTSSIKHLDELGPMVAKLSKTNETYAIVLIGSRAGKRAKKYSDWDVGLFAYPTPLSGVEYLRLKRSVEDITENIVRQVDLVNLNQAPGWFLENLKGPILFLGGNKESYFYLRGWIDGIQKESKAA